MLEQLLDLAKNQLGNQADAQNIAQVTGQSILNGVLQQAKNGDLSAIQELFSGQETGSTSAVVQNLLPSVVGPLAQQFGMSEQAANGFAQQAISLAMNAFNGQVQTANANGKQLDIAGILGSVMSGNSGINLSDGLDMKDAMGAINLFMGTNTNQQQGGGLDLGSIGSLVGSFLGGSK